MNCLEINVLKSGLVKVSVGEKRLLQNIDLDYKKEKIPQV